jgi:hypothetical protein
VNPIQQEQPKRKYVVYLEWDNEPYKVERISANGAIAERKARLALSESQPNRDVSKMRLVKVKRVMT